MTAKQLAKKILKTKYGNFKLSSSTCKCMENCVSLVGAMVYEQFQANQWRVDLSATHAIDVQLFKIGEKFLKGK